MLGVDEPIRVLRVIARLNVGGPSLHVSYLTEGLASRGYATTLAAGAISEGEASMAYRPIGQILVDMGAVPEDEVTRALEIKNRPLGEILVENGAAKPAEETSSIIG